MKRILTILSSIFLLSAVTCEASWLIFHKPEFRGMIVDIETHDPIEGAVVVAIYRKEQMAVAPDTTDVDIDAREALTDKNGEFVIPSYNTFINPFLWSIPVQFIIFKPGYYCTGPIGLEKEFSGSKEHKIEITAGSNKGLKYRVLKTGVLMLAKVAGKERIESYYNIGSDIPSFKKQLPIANDMEKRENPIVIRLEREWRNK